MKKLISLMLVMIMVIFVVAPAGNAFAADDGERPTVYLYGANTEDIYTPDGQQVFPAEGADINITEILMPALKELAFGMLVDDYSEISKRVYDALVPTVSSYATDKNGEASDGTAPLYNAYTQSVPVKNGQYSSTDYHLCYDWRLSPLETAKQLKAYIDRVIAATGEKKVNLMGRCYGANVIAAYLELYKDHAAQYVDDVAYIAPGVYGIDFVSALFTGEVYFSDEAVNNFAEYYVDRWDLIEDPVTREFILSMLDLLETVKTLGITMDMVNALVERLKDDLLPPIMRDGYARMLSYWSMIPEDKVDKAIEFIYGNAKEEYSEIITKIRQYRDTVQHNAVSTMKELTERGIDFYTVAKYNIPDYPLYKGSQAMSDGYILTYRQTFGGVYADCGKVLPQSYLEENKDSKYLSPDNKIDASTCLFPETTWFIKNLVHDVFPENLNQFTINLMNSEATVSAGVIPQFMTYENDEIVPTEGPDEDNTEQKQTNIFVRFLRALLNFFKNLLSGKLFPEKA